MFMTRFIPSPVALLALLALLIGCRGQVSHDPPIHLMWNMDNVKRFDAQEPNRFFADGRASRSLVVGTVAEGQLREDPVMERGVDASGAFATTLPAGMELNAALLDRGEGRYNIYCAPCHDRAGTGNGIVRQRGFIPPPDFHQDRLREFPVGQIVSAQAVGIRTMPSYAAQIPAADRWAIAAYVRALQISQGASREQVPSDIASQNGW